MVRPIRIPDVNPSELHPNADFSYSAGGFVEVYGNEPNSWDAIATCFFLDTANNVISYVQTISKILKPGGYWFNVGPLLYHYSDMPDEQSVEITLEELLDVIAQCGMEIKVHLRIQPNFS